MYFLVEAVAELDVNAGPEAVENCPGIDLAALALEGLVKFGGND